MKQIQLKAYAKVNLSIDVLAKRQDGYHEVCMIMQQVGLFDEIALSILADSEPGSIKITTDSMELPDDERNLAHRAASLMLTRYGIGRTDAIGIHINKRIPIAAGLAGGSADGAAVLHGLNQIWSLGLPLQELMELGLQLGADVPFCLMGQASLEPGLGFDQNFISSCALAEGIGERLRPLPPMSGWVILSKPSIQVSTADVYRALRLEEVKKRPNTAALILGLERGNFEQIQKSMYNVLEEISVKNYPAIGEAIEQMESIASQSLCPGKVMMSGSGPTIFAFSSEKEPLIPIYYSLKNTNSETFVVELL
jgi:4-diphosphocytidyl-2-C-methyl-D-erythritol kinase